MLVNPDRYPYSYMTPDGMPTGIMVDIFQKAAGRARLRYKFLKPADRSEYKAMLADGQADFVIDLTDDLSRIRFFPLRAGNARPERHGSCRIPGFL